MDINNNDINGLIINKSNNLNNSQNMNYMNNQYTSPNRRFNTENDNNNINIPKELNDLIEKFSIILKDYFNNDNLYFKNIKLISESINEQTLFGRCSINDIFLYLNQITYPRYNGVLANINEKYIKEKLDLINDRLNKIEELKENMNQNIKSSEIELISFYEESKSILQKMKIFYKYGKIINEKKFQNLEELNILKNKYSKLLNENNRLKVNLKINNSFQNQNQMNSSSVTKNRKNFINLSINNPQRINSCSKSCAKKYNMSASYSKNKRAPKININSIKKECYNNSNPSKNKNMENMGINIIVDLADMILKFLNDMKNLQEYIMKKNIGVKELKKTFETSKKNLKLFCEKIIRNKNYPDKIKNINIKNINHNAKNSKSKEKNNFETKINKLENALIEKNNKIKSLEKDIASYIEKNNILIKQNNELNKKIKNNNNDLNSNLININTLKEKQNKLLAELKEKNDKIKDLNSKLKEQVNKYNELLLIIEENNKLKEQINKNNNDDKNFAEIKNILSTLNDTCNKNINELINKDEQFTINSKKIENPQKNLYDNEEILNNLNNFKNISNENETLLGQIKNCNNIFEQINKDNI
jgi:hypothetical protein